MEDVRDETAFRALAGVALALASEHEVAPVLQRLADAARSLGGARYAAIGVPDGEGGFARFITSGMTAQEIAALGPLPRRHGLLGAMLEVATPYRTPDIRTDPRFRGWWPRGHPDMRSFLGVPIVAHGTVTGALYLTDKVDARAFSEDDEALMVLLAAHAAVAIDNARLHERSRELSVVEERNRLARELHDVVSQRLFAVGLAADSAATLAAGGDADRARVELGRVSALAREASEELRSAVFALRPAELERDGLATALGKHVDVLRRAAGTDVTLVVTGDPRLDPGRAAQVLRIAQEALQNAIRHAGPGARIAATLTGSATGAITLEVADDGQGFAAGGGERGRSLGLTTMEERARELGGRLTIESAAGAGTTVSLAVPGA